MVELNPLAKELLSALGREPAAKALEIGGGIAFWHYVPVRLTNDVDAWWAEEDSAAREAIAKCVDAVARAHGLTWAHRGQAGYESWDLKREGKTVFAFQVARKAHRLEPALASPWGFLQLESLPENLANKMTALVQRGAPRDFLDVAAVLERNLATREECWALWQTRNPERNLDEARSAVLANLQGLEARRPLASIADADAQQQAAGVRERIRQLAADGY